MQIRGERMGERQWEGGGEVRRGETTIQTHAVALYVSTLQCDHPASVYHCEPPCTCTCTESKY